MTMPILQLKLVSVLNLRECWQKRAARAKLHRESAYHHCILVFGVVRPKLPVVVTLTRLAPRELDSDNLQSGGKAVRDGVADYFSTDDRNPGIEWQYKQEKAKDYGIRIEIKEIQCNKSHLTNANKNTSLLP